MKALPLHLQKYIVDQDPQRYTPLEHAVWRYILRQLKSFLSVKAHKSYLEGLEKTGIDVEQIPSIKKISEHLENFGWRALPVSGFIPPAAFMELQSLGVLPIASDMRSIDHLLYTPAPDIVHEAAGHAPFIADTEYADYLKRYAQVAKKAIISKEDFAVYEAIRILSDVKENPNSTEQQIKSAEADLEKLSKAVSHVSEGSELSRMNWWTAEYGLIGDINDPKIFGAGLLSSVGESKWCLSDKVKKIPLSVACIEQAYDITEPQPQLFVARDFKHLSEVLEEFSNTMAYKTGGVSGLKKALKADSINTVEFENKIQISGVLKNYLTDSDSQPVYLQFNGPTQLAFNGEEISGHDKNYHLHGYGTPLGHPKNLRLSDIKLNESVQLVYASGIQITGVLTAKKVLSDDAAIYTFQNASCIFNNEKLFQPEWGNYDIIAAEKIVSVFGGPADRKAYGETDDFIAARVQTPQHSTSDLVKFDRYREIRTLREVGSFDELDLQKLFKSDLSDFPEEWLLFVELIEMAVKKSFSPLFINELQSHLIKICEKKPDVRSQIEAGLQLAHEKF